MKKRYLIIIALLLSTCLNGCNNKGDGKEQAKGAITYDENLEGLALLESVKITRPDKLKVIAQYEIAGMGDSKTTTYMYEGFEKTEFESEEGKEYIIYNPEEKTTYQYTDYAPTGFKMPEDESFTNEVMEGVEYFIAEEEELVKADIIDLEGSKTVYVESKSGGDGEEAYINKTWTSIQYGYPIKGESYFNEELLYSMEVTEITNEVDIDQAFFAPPEDIEFEAYDFNFDQDLEGDVGNAENE